MQNQAIYFYPIADLPNIVDTLFQTKYNLLNPSERGAAIGELARFISNLKVDLHTVIEHPYVDKVYRDEYYHYYSSKLYDYDRDCIRISFF